jgi:hypothetical protein
MNVGELIDVLSKLPERATVLVSSDEEGNRISRLDVAETATFVDYGFEIDLIADEDADEYEDDEPALAVVLWP